jgi:hypothetical protein
LEIGPAHRTPSPVSGWLPHAVIDLAADGDKYSEVAGLW